MFQRTDVADSLQFTVTTTSCLRMEFASTWRLRRFTREKAPKEISGGLTPERRVRRVRACRVDLAFRRVPKLLKRLERRGQRGNRSEPAAKGRCIPVTPAITSARNDGLECTVRNVTGNAECHPICASEQRAACIR